MRIRSMVAVGVVSACSMSALGQKGECGPVDFNETMIRRWLAEAAGSPTAAAPAAGLQAASPADLASPGEIRQADVQDPMSVFRHIFLSMPDDATVYPTESYYYYQFDLGPRRLSGNIRLLDAHEGKIHIGYFDVNETGVTKAATFGGSDGVVARTESPNVRTVTAFGRTVRFTLPPREAERPRSMRLASDERVLAGVFDESGLNFYMTYLDSVAGFLFVLDEERPVADTLIPLNEGSPRFLIGRRTRYIFMQDEEYGRKILVGVHRKQVEQNSYYDGPFDQVPPRLGIRAELEAAYPYVKLRGGIDEHGNFISQSGSRVAISPYADYESPEKLVATLTKKLSAPGADDSVARRWLRVTYESKRDFHRKVELLSEQQHANSEAGVPSSYSTGKIHLIYVSQGWPANHELGKSTAWPAEHIRDRSSGWPKNHETPTSTGTEVADSPSPTTDPAPQAPETKSKD